MGGGQSGDLHAALDLPLSLRRPEGLRNPVELWLAGGVCYNRSKRRRISVPAAILPHWRMGIETEAIIPATRDIFWIGLYTGMRLGEIISLQWVRVDLERRILQIITQPDVQRNRPVPVEARGGPHGWRKLSSSDVDM